MLDLAFIYFLIKFDLSQDLMTILHDGPWTILGHYLIVCPWTLDFCPSAALIDRMLAWVGFPELSVMYYNDDVLRVTASAIGTPI